MSRATPPSASPPVTPLPDPDFDPVHRFSSSLERAGKAEATIDAYHTDVADLVRAFAPRPPHELLPDDITTYLHDRAAAEEWTAATVRRHLQSIKAFYRYLVAEEGLRAPGPAEALGEEPLEAVAPFVLSESEVRAIFRYLATAARFPAGVLERFDLALYGLCYHAGLLVSEAVGLTRDAVHGAADALEVEVVGRRGRTTRVTLDAEVSRWLARWLDARPEPKLAEHAPFVFVHPRTRLHSSRQRAWYRLKTLARAAGLSKQTVAQIGPHTLRHSYAAHLAAHDADVAALRAALRQRSPRHAVKYVRRARPARGDGR